MQLRVVIIMDALETRFCIFWWWKFWYYWPQYDSRIILYPNYHPIQFTSKCYVRGNNLNERQEIVRLEGLLGAGNDKKRRCPGLVERIRWLSPTSPASTKKVDILCVKRKCAIFLRHPTRTRARIYQVSQSNGSETTCFYHLPCSPLRYMIFSELIQPQKAMKLNLGLVVAGLRRRLPRLKCMR